MNQTYLVALLLVPMFFLLIERSRRRAISQKIPLLPSLPGLPFIGNLHELGLLPHRSLRDLSKKHGPLMLLHLGSIPTLIVSSPKHAEEFTRTHDIVFASRPSLKVGNTLSYNNIDIAFSPYGECWRQMRRISVNHLLNQTMVHSFSVVRKEEVANLLEKIAHKASRDNSALCVTEMLNSLVCNIICRVVLGSSMSDEKRMLICQMVQRNSTLFSEVFLEDLFPRLRWLDVLLGLDRKLKTHFRRWDTLLEEFIEDHINREHIKATLLDMFAAGTDTSFITLDWSMAELIRNPEVMKKVQDEVRATANGEKMIREEHLSQMKYLNAVIKEVLRMHPPIPLLIPRESSQDCQIQGFHIPKKTRVIINAWAIGRDGAYWEDPEVFKPERFLGSTTDYKGRDYHFIPFGAGRRICPGLTFAVVIVELTLANLLHRFDWKLPTGISHKEFGMDDNPGLVAMRKEKLELVPMLVKAM